MSGIDDRYGAFVRAREATAVERLEEVVGMNSFTFDGPGVNRVGSRIAEWFQALGFQARTVPSVRPECGDHLLLERPGRGIGSIVMVSHLDTVYSPEEEQENDFRWRLEEDRMVGPGVADIKGGTIVLLTVLEALAECHAELFDRIHWRVLLNATEEGGCSDFPALLREASTGTLAALVYEAGFEEPDGASNVVSARKGSGRFRVEAFGRAAHSGHAHAQGANAITELAHKVLAIETLTDYERSITFNVGRIEGGRVVNSVPDRAWCSVDMRAATRTEFERGIERVLALANEPVVRSASDGHACRIEVTREPGYPPWPPNGGSDHLAKLARVVAAPLGLRIGPSHRGGASDGCHVCDLVPTLDGLGVIGRNIHCSVNDPENGRAQESASRSSIVSKTLLSVGLLERITGK